MRGVMDTNTAVAESTAGESGGSESAAAYRPHLDGLRAVAVYLVVLFHAGSGSFPGGYVGVDVFFVLSGFLVTQLLLRDIARNNSIRFGRFYARRFRRLLPAAFVALTVTAIVYTAIASPAEVRAAVGSFKAAFLYSTNWYFIHSSTGYFGADITTNPVLHFWSLAVEEQFYLLWPLALGGAFALTRRMDAARQMRTIRIAVAVGAVASAMWALWLRNSDPNRAYYGTDTRAYELLAGAFLALVPGLLVRAKTYRRAMQAATTVSIAALLVVASSWVTFDAIVRGIVVTIITCVLIVSLEAADGGLAQRALSTRAAVYLGKISYGTYLWHWLVILVVIKTFHLSTISTVGIAALVATALASLSFEMLEHPVRTSHLLDGHRRMVIAGGLTVSVLSALVLIPQIVDPASAAAPTASGSTVSGFTPVPESPSWRDAKAGDGPLLNCLGKPVSDCTIVHGTGKHILLIGDSHAWMLIPTFRAMARADNLTLSVSVRGGCPWQLDVYAPAIQAFGTTISPKVCQQEKADLYNRVLPALHPDLVVAVNFGYENPRQHVLFTDASGHALLFQRPAAVAEVETATTRSLARLRAGGRKVVLVEPIPWAPIDPVACLSKARVLQACRYTSPVKPDRLERFYRQLARQDSGVYAADIDRLVCPFLPICDPIVNDQIVKQDGTHLAVKFAESIAPALNTYLKQLGALPN
jgi:peptidoglycan/LPS O-acetylase OafA/YrhL